MESSDKNIDQAKDKMHVLNNKLEFRKQILTAQLEKIEKAQCYLMNNPEYINMHELLQEINI